LDISGLDKPTNDTQLKLRKGPEESKKKKPGEGKIGLARRGPKE